MKVTATVKNSGATHEVVVATAGAKRSLAVPAKPAGGGSAVNGGEFLMLALATCYCNDLYREAARLNIALTAVEVEASAAFDGVGLAASNVTYRARVQSHEPKERIELLLRETDAVAEIHNTMRAPTSVTLVPWQSES
jgi:organic hydroperoxide reductase OsmC/OhrA